jgi:hypothetical protein
MSFLLLLEQDLSWFGHFLPQGLQEASIKYAI